MNSYKQILIEGTKEICNIENPEVINKLLDFMDMVLETNKQLNLTAITDPNDFVIKHYLDSLSICNTEVFKNSSYIIDVGTGAGFPGIPLAIAYPDKKFVLMDSLNKRINFLKASIDILGLTNVECIHARAEDLGNSKKYRESFDLCVSRAVARLSVLSEYCLPLVKIGGYFTAYKTKNEDLKNGFNAVATLGGKVDEILDFPKLSSIPVDIDLDHRLLFIKKIRNTPKSYPRKSGTPAKNPL